MWPKLEQNLCSLPEAIVAAPERSLHEMVAEILAWTRSESNRRAEIPRTLEYLSDPELSAEAERLSRGGSLPHKFADGYPERQSKSQMATPK
jgi:hypothetical protein